MNHNQSVYSYKHTKACPRPPASPDEIGCPVCQISLANHPSHIRTDAILGHGYEAAAMRNEIRELNAGKFRDAELVVAAPCGHMFHRFCLRHYCFVYQQTNNTDHVECPVCSEDLSMIRFQPIDYNAHFGGPSKFDQLFNETTFMQKELQDRKDAEKLTLDSVAQKISDANIKLEAYRNHQRSMTDKVKWHNRALQEETNLKRHIKKCNDGIDAMHKENLNIIKMYLSIMKDQPEEVLHDKRIPQPLIPYLAVILADERLVKKFGEVLKPVEMNGIRSNTELLIKEILADVGARSPYSRKLDSTRNPFTKPTGKPVVVKVQDSSVSIFSRMVLDEESLQTILHQVKDPINKLHHTHHKLTSINKNGRNKKSVVTTPLGRSASDIQILFGPRKIKGHDPDPGFLLPPLESESNSNMSISKPLPRRRCKSTEPILMKEKVKKTVVVKVNKLNKSNQEKSNASRDMIPGACNQPEVNKELFYNVKLQRVSSPSQTSSQKNTEHDKIQERRISSKGFDSEESYKVFQFQEDKDNERHSTAGFTPNASGSMIYGNDGVDVDGDSDGYNPLTSLVDDVSKITFGTVKRVPCQVPGVDGNVSQSLMEYSVLLPKKISTSTNTDVNFNRNEAHPSESLSCDEKQPQWDDEDDIENAYRESECPQDSGRFRENRSMTGFLKGILPGPFLSPAEARGQQAVSYMTEKVPVYQSKWLTKLPSTRTDYLPTNIPTNPRKVERIRPRASNRFISVITEGQNPSRGNTKEELESQVTCQKYTVIDIPSSNNITHYPPATHRGHHQCLREYHDEVVQQIQRPTNPTHFLPPLSQRAMHSSNNSFVTLQRASQEMSSRYGENSYQSTDYCSDQCKQPHSSRYQHQQCSSLRNNSRERNHDTRLPGSSGGSTVENALVELCRGLSPPRINPSSQNRMPVHYEYSQNSFTEAVIRRNADNSSGQFEHQNHSNSRLRLQRESAMSICPDEFPSRMVRKGKRSRQQNTYVNV